MNFFHYRVRLREEKKNYIAFSCDKTKGHLIYS